MATETLGAHLRNLLTPYKTLLNIVKDINNGTMSIELLKKFECDNIVNLIMVTKLDFLRLNTISGSRVMSR